MACPRSSSQRVKDLLLVCLTPRLLCSLLLPLGSGGKGVLWLWGSGSPGLGGGLRQNQSLTGGVGSLGFNHWALRQTDPQTPAGFPMELSLRPCLHPLLLFLASSSVRVSLPTPLQPAVCPSFPCLSMTFSTPAGSSGPPPCTQSQYLPWPNIFPPTRPGPCCALHLGRPLSSTHWLQPAQSDSSEDVALCQG